MLHLYHSLKFSGHSLMYSILFTAYVRVMCFFFSPFIEIPSPPRQINVSKFRVRNCDFAFRVVVLGSLNVLFLFSMKNLIKRSQHGWHYSHLYRWNMQTNIFKLILCIWLCSFWMFFVTCLAPVVGFSLLLFSVCCGCFFLFSAFLFFLPKKFTVLRVLRGSACAHAHTQA